MSNFITEYREQRNKIAQELALHSEPIQMESFEDPEAFIITFSEEGEGELKDSDMMDEISEFFEHEENSDDGKVDEDELLMDSGDMESMPFSLPGSSSVKRLPGAVDYVDDADEEEDKEPEVEVETDWENDRDVRHFMPYILKQYPGGIPKHDGTSTLGCERAILFLTKLNKEISEALRSDPDERDSKADDGSPAGGSPLDITALENIRVNMIRDMVTLKEHVKKINKKLKRVKKSNGEIELVKIGEVDISSDLPGLSKSAEIVKEATTARIQLVMTPFERAITGIILNSVVSAGKPLEEVYEFLKKKYKFTDREELALLQLLMDMGQPIFKDRGMIGESDHDEDGQGLDFIKNYFG